MLMFQLMTKLLKHSHNTGLLNLLLHIEKQLFYSWVKNTGLLLSFAFLFPQKVT